VAGFPGGRARRLGPQNFTPAHTTFISPGVASLTLARAPLPVAQDVRSDPTLPRTNEVRCPNCSHTEAVFFSASTEEGMTLFFNCTGCAHRWRDHV